MYLIYIYYINNNIYYNIDIKYITIGTCVKYNYGVQAEIKNKHIRRARVPRCGVVGTSYSHLYTRTVSINYNILHITLRCDKSR